MHTPDRSRRLSLLGATMALLSAAPAQQPIDDVMWVAAGGRLLAHDRFGKDAGMIAAPASAGPVARAPDGALWYVDGATLVRRGAATTTHTLPGPALDYEVDASSRLWAAVSIPPRLVVIGPAGATVASVTLPAVPTELAIDDTGAGWVVFAAGGGPMLGRYDIAAGTSATFAPAIGPTIGLEVELEGGRTWLWTASALGNQVFRIDAATGINAVTYPVGGAADRWTDLAVDARGGVLLAGSSLVRLDPASGSAEVVTTRPVDSVWLDPAGSVWFAEAGTGTVMRLASDGHTIDAELARTAPRADDPAGYRLAAVVAPARDSDADGIADRAELEAGTNPFDAQSLRDLGLQTDRLRYRTRETVRLTLRGNGEPAVVVFGATDGGHLVLPGIRGEVRIRQPFPVALPAIAPSTNPIAIPDDPALPGLTLCAQALYAGPTLRLSDQACFAVVPSTTRVVVEAFTSDAMRDRAASAGSWTLGRGDPGPLGGTGKHGSFDPALGTAVGPAEYEWDVDDVTLPGTHTELGLPLRVTDGRFEFTDFVIPAGTTVRFVGSRAPIVRVRGEVRVDGVLDVGGRAVSPAFDARATFQLPTGWVPADGQAGTAGGPGGGRGGRGGRGADGVTSMPQNHGQVGDDLVVPGLSGYSGAVAGTGGPGSSVWPASGQSANVTFLLFTAVSGMAASGGGGGGYFAPGGQGVASYSFTTGPNELAPPTAGGSAIAFLPLPFGTTSLEHFPLGGAGGGGGGSQPMSMTRNDVLTAKKPWNTGGGGSGGGGALALRSGGDCSVGAAGSVAARGGDGAQYRDRMLGAPAPGGGGSGGSVLVQVGGRFLNGGTIDLRGGPGSVLYQQQTNGKFARTEGGPGAPGYVRLELPVAPTTAALGTVLGPAVLGPEHVGRLFDRDVWSGFRSLWYRAHNTTAPSFQSYRLDVELDGTPATFSDDPTAFNPANQPGSPVRLFLQGGRLDAAGGGQPVGPWRELAADLDRDHADGFRFLLLVDRSVYRSVVATRLEITYRD